jgi:hypothetical protein
MTQTGTTMAIAPLPLMTTMTAAMAAKCGTTKAGTTKAGAGQMSLGQGEGRWIEKFGMIGTMTRTKRMTTGTILLLALGDRGDRQRATHHCGWDKINVYRVAAGIFAGHLRRLLAALFTP